MKSTSHQGVKGMASPKGYGLENVHSPHRPRRKDTIAVIDYASHALRWFVHTFRPVKRIPWAMQIERWLRPACGDACKPQKHPSYDSGRPATFHMPSDEVVVANVWPLPDLASVVVRRIAVKHPTSNTIVRYKHNDRRLPLLWLHLIPSQSIHHLRRRRPLAQLLRHRRYLDRLKWHHLRWT